MDYAQIKHRFLDESLSHRETITELCESQGKKDLAEVITLLWTVQAQQDQKALAVTGEPPTKRLDHLTVVGLIDSSLLSGALSASGAYLYLTDEGMPLDTAKHHLDTLIAIRDRDAERAAYHNDPDNAPRYCTRCGRKTPADGLSKRGNCAKCRAYAETQNRWQLAKKTGPYYTHWREQMIQCLYSLEDEQIEDAMQREPALTGDANDAAIEENSTDERDETTWECPICGVENEESDPSCFLCDHRRERQ